MTMKKHERIIEWAAPPASPTGSTVRTTVRTGHVHGGSLGIIQRLFKPVELVPFKIRLVNSGFKPPYRI